MRKLSFVLALSLLTACDDDNGGPIDIGDLGGAIADTYCDLYVRCGLIDSLATCRKLDIASDAEIDPDLKAAVDAGKVVYHPDKAGECLASLGNSCELTNAPGIRNQSLACDETFEGTVGDGGPCAIDEECISQSCNVPSCTEACCQGTCAGGAPPVRPRAGESCATSSRCVDSYCDRTTAVCTTYKANGTECVDSTECLSASCVSHVCKARVNTGGACGSTVAGCRLIGDRCDGETMTCRHLGLLGDACAADIECSNIYRCDTTSSTCVLGPELGDACVDTLDCIGATYCDEATLVCTTRKIDGQACTDDSECASGTCDVAGTNVCITPPVCI